MKVFKKVLLVCLICVSLAGCSMMKKTAKGAVEDFLNQYKSLSSNVLEDLDKVVDDEDLTDEQKEKYRDILKRQYEELKYEVQDEEYDGDKATVKTKITVIDYYKVQKDASKYLQNNEDKFLEDGVYSNKLYMDYKLEQMDKAKDTKDYTINFKLQKNDKGNYEVIDLTNEDLEKIHGIYNYENEK